jgi:hypothetical protein
VNEPLTPASDLVAVSFFSLVPVTLQATLVYVHNLLKKWVTHVTVQVEKDTVLLM